MVKKNINNKKLFIIFFGALVLVLTAFLIYSLVTGKISFGSLDNGWDGHTVATSFNGGNGTENNPYIISTAEEFMYFKSLVEGDNYNVYQDKYYALDADLNFNNNSFSGIGIINQNEDMTEDRTFKGYFDGRGHTIYDILIDKSNVIDEYSYYSLFSKVQDAHVMNLNIDGFKIVTDESDEKIVTGVFGNILTSENDEVSENDDVEELSEIRDLSIRNISIDYSKNSSDEDNDNDISQCIGIVSCNTSLKSSISNIYLDGLIIGREKTNKIGIIANDIFGKVSNVVSDFDFQNIENIDFSSDKIDNQYIIFDGKVYFNEHEMIVNDVVSLFNESIVSSYYWDIQDDKFVIKEYEKIDESVEGTSSVLSKGFSFSIKRSGAKSISLHESGVDGDTVYVNDLDSDYRYYLGLNYTENSNGTWPSGSSSDAYTDSSLARVYIAYSGEDINSSSVVGNVSLDEQYSNLIYYKYYPIDNGYVTIPLIDNPYGDRPDNRAFNGWITDYDGAVVSLDLDTYTRYVKVPASSEISITMYASWTEATVVNSATSNTLKSAVMQPVATGVTPVFNVPTLYSRGTINSGNSYNGTSYPSGAVNENGQSLSGQRCRRISNNHPRTCTYYTVYSGTLTEGMTGLYQLLNGTMTAYTVPAPIRYDLTSNFMNYGDNVTGYFKKVRVNGSLVGYYNNSGVLQNSGSCNGGSNCDYYQLMQYDVNNIINSTNYDQYYYLTTRDTNIVYLTGNINGFTNTKPITVTGINNGSDHTTYRINLNSSSINANADLRIEYCHLYSGQIQPDTSGPSSTNNYYVYGNFYNVKIGRGMPIEDGTYTTGNWWSQQTHTGTYFNAKGVVGGKNNSTSDTPTKYSLIVESGYYNYISGVSTTSSSATYNVVATATYGNDIDRVSEDNDTMGVYYNVASSYGGTVSSGSYTIPFITTTFKSGSYGEDTTDTAAGVYVGGLNGGTLSSPATTIVEGGKILYLNGGPLISNNLTNYNAIYIYIKGGEIDCVFGGAARTETYGNRIISMTGGVVRYSVFGGSNGVEGNNSDSSRGTLNGKTFIRIGGNAIVGSANDTVFGIESGSVFGAGNGNSTYPSIGSVNDSRIVIDDDAVINKNVYGGGNFGAMIAQSGNSTTTSISVHGAHIKGSVYGGGNKNGSGSDSVTSTVSILVDGGVVDNSVYGGSCEKGRIYGSTSVMIDGGHIKTDVYGGGEGGFSTDDAFGTYVRDNVIVVVSDGTIDGNVYGGSAFGTVNAVNQNTTTSTATTTVTVSGGVVRNNVFGGGKGSDSYTPKVVGDITVNVTGGSIGKVFGGFDASGKPSADDVVYLSGGTIGNAFGGGNNANQDTTDIRLQGSVINGNLYGGSNLLGTVTESHVTVTSGSVVDIYGGNNLDGLTLTTNVSVTGGTISGDIYGGGNEAVANVSNVTISGLTNNSLDVYGGGKKAGVTTTNVTIENDTLHNVFGGSNISGTVGTSNVHIQNSSLSSAYGGNNQGGVITTTNIDTSGSNITNLFGGGDHASSGVSNVTIYDGTIINVYGGGNEAGLTTSNVVVVNGTITNLFGGSNESGNLSQSNIHLGDFYVDVDVSYTKRAPGDYPQSSKPTYAEISVTLTNLTDEAIDDWEIALNIPNSTIFSNYSQSDISVSGNVFTVNSTNRYYGLNSLAVNGSYTFEFSVLSDEALDDFDITSSVIRPAQSSGSSINIQNVYGGNNHGGVTTSTNIIAKAGNVHTLYGGGNEASVGFTNVVLEDITAFDVYGGGNAAGVNGNTHLDIDNSVIFGNVYGGGNEGIVGGNTVVYITDAGVLGNAFAGGNGSTAVVHGNSTITIDGSTEIGTSTSVAPNAGCVFGSGNAASTGVNGTDSSVAKVNIVGGIIHGNVYGGPKMAVVYGVTETNIGTDAVSNNNLHEDDIIISGTVFGGGESNANGSETYDWSFISVTRGITVNINGNNYITNNHDFVINGSIFGSGNASSSSGNSDIYIKNLGTKASPNKSISVQRADTLVIDSSVIELEGTTDRTNEYSDIKYSFNMIDELIIKNGTTLLLKHNANMLKELYSGVDINGTLVPATVDIDDQNMSVSANVDNRIYMVPGQNLNITINQSATAYGRVTGMTFFGMYTQYDNGSYRFGLYDDSISYGDSGNAGLEIIGGSYVIGLRNINHDITKDGFYSNYLNEDFTEVTTAYIDPSPIGETGYRWIIGFEAINYNFSLTASKYSSLGTYELQLIDFADGNTVFEVLGFDSTGLNNTVSLVDSDSVPRVARTQDDANGILGLSMKSETQEWTGYGTTKFLSNSTGITGTREYKTDSRKLPPSLMFYLYHAKNITAEGPLGTVIITLRADIPKNEIEYDIKFITITIDLVARRYDDADSYDASITYDKRYEMPSSTLVNITNQSQFSTYYSLIAWEDHFENVYGNNNTNFHVLTTNTPLPVNTMITMLDYGANDDRPEYYYYRITQSIYDDSLLQLSQYNEVTYRLSDFIKMDSVSSNNTYVDSEANLAYYDEDAGLVDEEFMFIFDFKETTVTGNHLDNSMLFELRNSEDRVVYSVLGIRQNVMVYNTFESSNVVLNQTITGVDNYLYYNVPDNFTYSTEVQYDQTENRQSIIDTNYESSNMGLNITLYDRDDVAVSSSLLVGSSVTIDNVEHFADGDGVFRIKLADKVSNLNKNVYFTVNKDLPSGEYTVRYTLFASNDGLHNSVYENSVSQEFNVIVVSADNFISVTCDDLYKVVDGDTGLNLKGTNSNIYTVKYSSELNNPNFRIEIFKRDTTTIDSTSYDSISFNDLFSDNLTSAGNNEIYITMGNNNQKSFTFTLNDELVSGTYKIVFKLYDNDQLIDDDVKYVIVKKNVE